MSNQRAPCVIHFVSDGKPWSVLLFEYVPDGPHAIPASTLEMLGGQVRVCGGFLAPHLHTRPSKTSRQNACHQVMAHALWRKAFFKASGDRPPENRVLVRAMEVRPI
jgi:hypothetical protein